jgi:hypothetical protein
MDLLGFPRQTAFLERACSAMQTLSYAVIIFYGAEIFTASQRNKVLLINSCSRRKADILKRLRGIGASKFAFVHIDRDISPCVRDIFQVPAEGDLLSDSCYILFDDYGCQSDLRTAADEELARLSTKWDVRPHSNTALTQNFRLQRND